MNNAGYWHKVPMIRLALPFATGCGVSMFYPVPLFYTTLACMIMVAITVFYIIRNKPVGIYITFIFLFGGMALHQWQDVRNHTDWFMHHDFEYAIVTITEPPIEKKNSWKLTARVDAIQKQYGQVSNTKGRLLVYVQKIDSFPPVQYGTRIQIAASWIKEMQTPRNPEEFNYKRYLAFRHIHHQVYLHNKQLVILDEVGGNFFFKAVYATQKYFQHILITYLGEGSERGIAQALLYGNDDALDDETVQAYAHTGTLHVLAVSGMHVGIIFMFLSKLFLWVERIPRGRIIKALSILSMLWIYSILCSTSPSILRATVMFSFIIIADLWKRNCNIYNTLAASAFALMLFDMNIISNVGFQLSYLAVIGIVYLQPLIYDWFIFRNKIADWVWGISSVSIAAQLATSPIGLLYFHQFPNVFLFSNLFIIPLTIVILYGCLLLVAVSPIHLLAQLVGYLLKLVIFGTNYMVKLVEKLPYAYVEGIQISIAQSILLYILLFALVLFLLRYSVFYIKMAFVSLLIFFLIDGNKVIDNSNKQQLTVYNVSKHAVISMVNDRQQLLITDSNFLKDTDKRRFHIRQHGWKLGIKQSNELIDTGQSIMLTVKDKLILISGKKVSLSKNSYHPDYFIINYPISQRYMEYVQPKQVIIASNIKPRQALLFSDYYQKMGVPVYVIKDSTAFDVSLHSN
jgi:competence protein ComEC